MYKLIIRTKENVRHVDHQNFKRLQKMLLARSSEDEAESDTTSVSGSVDIESEPPRYMLTCISIHVRRTVYLMI